VAAGGGVVRPPRPYRVAVTSAKAADLRRFLARHAKSNSIDAETLARLPLVAPTGLTAVEFGSPARGSLDRRVRAVARLTAEIGRGKNRIRALAQQLVPTIGAALSEGLNHTDLAVLERYADPRALLAAGPARLTRLIATTSRGQLGQAKAQALRTAAAEAVDLWEGDSAIAIEDLAAEVASEVRWSAPPRPSAAATSTPGMPPWLASIRPVWPPACPNWARSAPRSWSPRWAAQDGSPTATRSRPSPGWCPQPTRPARPTASTSP
jgi:hypothetical protein